MKTNSLQPFRKSHAKRRVILVAIVLVTSIWLFYTPLAAVLSFITSPLASVRIWWTDSEATLPVYFTSRDALEAQLREITTERNSILFDKDRLRVLEEEVLVLKRQTATQDDDRIVAGVLRRPNETPYDTVVVDAGSNDGVLEGALVYADRAVVGMVSRTLPESSLITLFSSPHIETPLYIYGPNIFARGTGMGGGVVRVGVPQGIPLAVGDPVVVPLTDSAIYGHIGHIESDPSNPEQFAFVVQIPQIQNVRYVAIARTPLPNWSIKEAEEAMVEAKNRLMSTSSSVGLFIDVLPVASTSATTSVQVE